MLDCSEVAEVLKIIKKGQGMKSYKLNFESILSKHLLLIIVITMMIIVPLFVEYLLGTSFVACFLIFTFVYPVAYVVYQVEKRVESCNHLP
jgi:uncharacterized membrane protein